LGSGEGHKSCRGWLGYLLCARRKNWEKSKTKKNNQKQKKKKTGAGRVITGTKTKGVRSMYLNVSKERGEDRKGPGILRNQEGQAGGTMERGGGA